MGWVKLDDSFSEHPKVEAAGDHAAWLYVCGLQYCSRALTDGFIPVSRVARLTGLPKPLKLAERLVVQRLWEPVQGGFRVHDYEKHQRSAEQIKRERAASAERQSRRRNGGSHGVTEPAVTDGREEERREEKNSSSSEGVRGRAGEVSQARTVFSEVAGRSDADDIGLANVWDRCHAGNLDFLGLARHCAQHLRDNPGKPTMRTFHRFVDHAKPQGKQGGRPRRESPSDLLRALDGEAT